MNKLATITFLCALPLITTVAAVAQDQQPQDTKTDRYESDAGYADMYSDPYTLGLDVGEGAALLREQYNPKRLQLVMASGLSVQETAIGIRADQQDAWRAYTSAALEMIPAREKVDGMFGMTGEAPQGPQAFGRAEYMADMLSEYGDKARSLKQAITNLRAKLSPEQLEAARLPRLLRG